MEKIIHKLINEFTEGVDTYTHNKSTWLIFTESKQWVIELTDTKTLWYNYNFFKSIFAYASLDCVQNQHLITKWVEDNIINKVSDIHFRDARDRKQQFEETLENGVRHTEDMVINLFANDALENGVKYTSVLTHIDFGELEDTIKNGVKETNATLRRTLLGVDDIIQNGVRDTQSNPYENVTWIEGVIKQGVKHTGAPDWNRDKVAEYAIENGVKEIYEYKGLRPDVKYVIQGGVKSTGRIHKDYAEVVEYLIKNGVKETNYDTSNYIEDVEEVIQDGVKETKEMLDWVCTDQMLSNVMNNGVRTSNPRQYVGGDIVDKVIDKGVIETHDDVYHHKGRIDGVIKNGVKETKTPGDCDLVSTIEWMNENNTSNVPRMIDDVIENGVKETVAAGYTDPKTNLLHIKWGDQIDDVIDNGVKEIKTPNKDGDIKSTLEWMYKNNYQDDYNGSKMINNVIENGVKETNAGKKDWTITTNDVIESGVKETKSIGKEAPNYPRPVINHIIKNGEKINGTYADGQRQSEKCKSVVKYGTKNPTS